MASNYLPVKISFFLSRYLYSAVGKSVWFSPASSAWARAMSGTGTAENRDEADHVDRLRAQWARELPDLDTEPMAILGRAYRLSNMMRGSIEATFAGFDLDRGEFDVIATLRRSGPPYRLMPTELYTSLMISSGGLTHRLDRLEKAGLIKREKSSS